MDHDLVCFYHVMVALVCFANSVPEDEGHDISCKVSPFASNKLDVTFLGNGNPIFSEHAVEESDKYSRQLCFTDSAKSENTLTQHDKSSASRGDSHKSDNPVPSKAESRKQRCNKKLKGSKRQRKKKKKKKTLVKKKKKS